MPNRYICDVLKEMRKCNETRNYSYLLGLIEEAQTMANRMEARLEDYSDMYGSWNDIHKAKRELRKIEDKKNQLQKEIEKLKSKVEELGGTINES